MTYLNTQLLYIQNFFQQKVLKDTDEAFKHSKDASKNVVNEVVHELQGFLETLKKAQPDLQPVVTSYKNQLKELKEELENDEGFTEASENM